jgi:hypothetical protein
MRARHISATTILAGSSQGKTDATQTKRTQQMMSELERGGVYMGMKHAGSAVKKKAKKSKAKRAR